LRAIFVEINEGRTVISTTVSPPMGGGYRSTVAGQPFDDAATNDSALVVAPVSDPDDANA